MQAPPVTAPGEPVQSAGEALQGGGHRNRHQNRHPAPHLLGVAHATAKVHAKAQMRTRVAGHTTAEKLGRQAPGGWPPQGGAALLALQAVVQAEVLRPNEQQEKPVRRVARQVVRQVARRVSHPPQRDAMNRRVGGCWTKT